MNMKNKLNVILECYSINPVLDSTRNFKWLGNQLPFLEIGNDIQFLIINIKKIKLHLEESIDAYLKQNKLHFPFTYEDFIIFANEIASSFSKVSNWLKKMQYMKDYILAPLLVSSNEIRIGIIILDNIMFDAKDILDSNNYLSHINMKKNPIANSDVKWKCDILGNLLAMRVNNLTRQMKLYIMNSRGYIPPVIIHRMPRKIKAINLYNLTVQKLLANPE